MASKQRGSCIGGARPGLIGSKWSTLFHSFSGKACISERLSMKLQNSDTQVETNLTVEGVVGHGGHYHSQSPEAFFCHASGIKRRGSNQYTQADIDQVRNEWGKFVINKYVHEP
ncbi:uncharacterized protein LOC133740179 isoform X4 [Rosa rugosa]|uniref:uncharacterized protein LOC133740179 isoform X4 n=1 Tax=Rosa rugosa TaxID=74645 RepID=UPI002B4127FE|nr:uncharacterized protein LOC133740179 isoform X4 [Rosa rugosa]